MESVAPIAQFRIVARDRLALVLGALALCSAPVNTWQAWERSDPFLIVTAVVYLTGSVAMLAMRRLPSVPARPFLLASTYLVLGAALTETPAGSSHLLGIGCILLLVFGHLTLPAAHQHAWQVVSSSCFPLVLFARQLYRPHPLLDDPLELVPQAFAGGLAVYGVGVVVDRLVVAFAAQTERAQRAERAKDRFLENMSHELRTPMTAVLGYAEMLEEEAFEDRERALEDLGRIQQSARHLLGILGDLLDLSRLGQGTDALHLVPTPVAIVVDAARADVGPQLDAARNSLVVDVPEIAVLADPVALRRILVVLLGNAAKFTSDGTITVTAVADPARVTLEVRDTGIGFSPAMAEAIFDPFVQVDDSSTRVHGGTGLGLAIARSLAASMHGTLTARAVPDEGAVFTLVLPRADPAPTLPGVPPDTGL